MDDLGLRPDRCASTSRELVTKLLLGAALNNTDADTPPTAGPANAPDVTPLTPPAPAVAPDAPPPPAP